MCGIFAIFGNACEKISCNGKHHDKKHKKETLRKLFFSFFETKNEFKVALN